MSTRQLVQAALDSTLNEARQTRHEQLTAQRAAVVQQLADTLDGWPDNIVITPAQQQLVADIDELTKQLASLSAKHDEQLAVLMANVSP